MLLHCASGNHICTGNTGTFTEKPKNINKKNINCLLSKKIEFKKKSNEELPLFKYILKKDNNTKTEPNKVYIKNW